MLRLTSTCVCVLRVRNWVGGSPVIGGAVFERLLTEREGGAKPVVG